jgi:nucleolar complex protein 3
LDNFEEPSDEEDLDDDDMDQFLAEAEDKKPVVEQKKKKEDVHDSDEEMDYETKPRKVASEWTRKDYHTKLPIKLPGGRIHQLDEAQDDSEEEEEEAVVVEKVEEEAEEEEEVEEEQPKLSKKEYLLKKKEELALIAGNLQGDPEEYVGQLRTLRTIYREDNVTVKKLALLTQLAVYKDIIPGYRIRPLTGLEEETQVSRDVKKMREYEKSLLANYELYLKDLNVLLSSKLERAYHIEKPTVINNFFNRKKYRRGRFFGFCCHQVFM